MYDRSNLLAEERLLERAHVPQVEHVNRQLVFHAHRDGRRVHHFQAQVDRVNVLHFIELLGVRVLLGVAVVHPVDLGGFDQHIRADLGGAQRRSRIGGEEWVARVSVEKNGLPVPPPKITTRPFSRWRMARRRM